jgi:hypothetical protein
MPSQSFMRDKNITYSHNANHTTAYHNYVIVFEILHRMLEAAASAESWYVSARLDGVKSQNTGMFILLVQTKFPTFLSCCTSVVANLPVN